MLVSTQEEEREEEREQEDLKQAVSKLRVQ